MPDSTTPDSTTPDPAIRVLRSAARFRTEAEGIVTRHCFSFGDHYDPDNLGFGDLMAINDEHVDAGHGYDSHRHSAAEIVTWVLDGELAHEDSAGNVGTIRPDTVQRMSAGSGVRHTERNASRRRPVRFIQMWLRTNAPDAPPSYGQADLGEQLREPGFVLAVSPKAGEAPVGIGTRGAGLWIARLPAEAETVLPDAPLRHLQVVRGSVTVTGQDPLGCGDSARISAPGHLRLEAHEPSELLLWGMRRSS